MYIEIYSKDPLPPHQEQTRLPRGKGCSSFQQMQMDRVRVHVKAVRYWKGNLACVSHRHSSRSYHNNYAHSGSYKLGPTTISKQALRMLRAYDVKVHFVNKPTRRYGGLLRDDPIQDTKAARTWSRVIESLSWADEPNAFRGSAARSTVRCICRVKRCSRFQHMRMNKIRVHVRDVWYLKDISCMFIA